jgi:hypothetical protein
LAVADGDFNPYFRQNVYPFHVSSDRSRVV